MAPRREKKTISRSVKCNVLFEFFMSSVQVHTTNPGKSCNRTFFTKLNNRDVSSLVPLCYLRLPIGFILMFLKWFHNGSIEDHSSERIPITVINWLSRLLSSRVLEWLKKDTGFSVPKEPNPWYPRGKGDVLRNPSWKSLWFSPIWPQFLSKYSNLRANLDLRSDRVGPSLASSKDLR